MYNTLALEPNKNFGITEIKSFTYCFEANCTFSGVEIY